jgi:hypothetical protein
MNPAYAEVTSIGVDVVMTANRPRTPDLKTLARQAKVVFRPVWNVETRHLTGFILRPVAKRNAINPDGGAPARFEEERDLGSAGGALFATGKVRTGPSAGGADLIVEEPEQKEDRGRLEAQALTGMGLLAKAAATAEEALEQGRKAVFIAPVSFSTLHCDPYRRRYLALLRQVQPHLRALIVLQIANIPAYAPRYWLRRVQAEVAPHCRALILASDLTGVNLEGLAPGSIHACALSLATPHAARAECDVLNRFAEQTDSLACSAMADGISSTAALCAAVGAGFRYIAGPAVSPDCRSIDGIRPFGLADVYLRRQLCPQALQYFTACRRMTSVNLLC